MRFLILLIMCLGIVAYAANFLSKSINGGVRLFHASNPDISTSVDELNVKCESLTEWDSIDGSPQQDCLKSIRQYIENAETRGILAWKATSNDKFLICGAELKNLSDPELANWFVTRVANRTYVAGDIVPAEVMSSISMMEEYRCTD